MTSDRAVREALSIGIDRQTIIDNALNGIGSRRKGLPIILNGEIPHLMRITEKMRPGRFWKQQDGRKVRTIYMKRMVSDVNSQSMRQAAIRPDISWLRQ